MPGALAEHTILILHQQYAAADYSLRCSLNRERSFTNRACGFVIVLRHLFAIAEKIGGGRHYFAVARSVTQHS